MKHLYFFQPPQLKYLPYVATPTNNLMKKGSLEISNMIFDIYEKSVSPKFFYYFSGGNHSISNVEMKYFTLFKNFLRIF